MPLTVRVNLLFSPCRSLTPSWPYSWASCRSPCGSPPGWSWRWGRSRAPPPAPPPPRAPGYPGPQPLHSTHYNVINKGYYEYILTFTLQLLGPPAGQALVVRGGPCNGDCQPAAGCQLYILPITDKIICLNLILPNRTWWLVIRCQLVCRPETREGQSLNWHCDYMYRGNPVCALSKYCVDCRLMSKLSNPIAGLNWVCCSGEERSIKALSSGIECEWWHARNTADGHSITTTIQLYIADLERWKHYADI